MGHSGDSEAHVVISTSRAWSNFMEEVTLRQMVFHVEEKSQVLASG